MQNVETCAFFTPEKRRKICWTFSWVSKHINSWMPQNMSLQFLNTYVSLQISTDTESAFECIEISLKGWLWSLPNVKFRRCHLGYSCFLLTESWPNGVLSGSIHISYKSCLLILGHCSRNLQKSVMVSVIILKYFHYFWMLRLFFTLSTWLHGQSK